MLDKPSPTDEQLDIVNSAVLSTDNMMIEALAGTGKTHTLEAIGNALPKRPFLYLVFNKRNAEEATGKMPYNVEVRTLNSVGHRAWARTMYKNLSVATDKMYRLFQELANETKSKSHKDELWQAWPLVRPAISLAKAVGYVPADIRQAVGICERHVFHSLLDEAPDDLACDLIDELLRRSIRAAFACRIDFDDQVYMPAVFRSKCTAFPVVLVDEYQDLSPTNHALLAKLATSRLIGVGDPYQCHPPGTMIRITGGGIAPIEDIKVGQQVATYSTRAGRWAGLAEQGREVQDKIVSLFDGYLIAVTANDKCVKMTPNHKCVVRISRTVGGCVLYLMRRDNRYRIGTSRVRYEGNSFGPALRARQEKADAIWILDVYPNKEDAQVAEQAYSIKFGIPTNLFESWQNQQQVDSFWNIIGDNTTNAVTILEHFGRDIKLPIWKAGDRNFIGFHRACEIHAANLVPQLMTMLTFPDGDWHQIDTEYIHYIGPVCGLTVAPTEGGKRTYIANDILVHNSIYGFRGAKAGGMDVAKTQYSMSTYPLTLSFRCPSEIVSHVHWRVPHFRSFRRGGTVSIAERFPATDFPDGCAIISRNNAPILRTAFRLVGIGKSVNVAGTEIGTRLVSTMRKLGPTTLRRVEVCAAIDDWLEAKLAGESKTAEDMAECMRIFAMHGVDLEQAIAYAEHLFRQEGSITLTTGHKAKGLEWDTVFHLDPWLVRKQPTEQAKNLDYVISTRSSNTLVELNSDNIEW